MTTYTPLHLANTFIIRHGGDRGINHMKLQKLLFFSYGWWLAGKDTPLLTAKPEVWRYGPVFSSVYWQFNHFRDKLINAPETSDPFEVDAPCVPSDDAEVTRFVDAIWKKYGGFTGFELSDMTHRPGTPWHVVASKYNYRVPNNLEIEDEITKSYFSSLARTGNLA